LTGGVCIKLLIKLRHNQKEPTNPTLVPHAANNRRSSYETELKGIVARRLEWQAPKLFPTGLGDRGPVIGLTARVGRYN
jgi:hypothetical protein